MRRLIRGILLFSLADVPGVTAAAALQVLLRCIQKNPKDVEEFMGYAKEENLEAVEVAVVTESPRLVLSWRGKEIVNLSRAFLDTNGAHQETAVAVDIPNKADSILTDKVEVDDVKEKWLDTLRDLNVCSQKGLV